MSRPSFFMKTLFYNPVTNTILEVDPEDLGATQIVAEKLRSPADAQLLASSLLLLETAQQAERAFEWILGHVNLRSLPTELQPLKLHLEKARQAIRMSGR